MVIPANGGTEGAPAASDVPFYYNLNVIITVFVLSTVFTISVVAAAFIRKKSKSTVSVK